MWSHPCQGNREVIGCAVVYYARAAHAFSAGIEYRYCIVLKLVKTFRYMFMKSACTYKIALFDTKFDLERFLFASERYQPSSPVLFHGSIPAG